MLLWEALTVPNPASTPQDAEQTALPPRALRLPFDTRCTALTKNGSRCRGRVLKTGEFCVFHDPEIAARRRKQAGSTTVRRKRRLTHLPDGYLRKLSSISAVGDAMDRVYREVRLGIITTEMGSVLFNVLTRLMDSGLITTGSQPARTKAARLRPKLARLILTRKEKRSWNNAVDRAMRAERRPRPAAEKRNAVASPDVTREKNPSLSDSAAALVLRPAS